MTRKYFWHHGDFAKSDCGVLEIIKDRQQVSPVSSVYKKSHIENESTLLLLETTNLWGLQKWDTDDKFHLSGVVNLIFSIVREAVW